MEYNVMLAIRPDQFALFEHQALERFADEVIRRLAAEHLDAIAGLTTPIVRRRVLYALGHQAMYAAFSITTATFWLVLDERGRYGEARLAGWGAAGFATMLVMSMLLNRGRSRRRR